MKRRRWLRRRPLRPAQVIAWGIAVGATALVSTGLVYAAFSISTVGGALATVLVVVLLAVIWTESRDAR